jgi:RIO kinase 1
MQSLETLITDGVVDEVIGQLKTGKEAEVWLVRHQDQVLAAKIYKARHHRNFRNNAEYKEGRQVRNSRTQRAMDRGSRFGVQASEEAWKSAESEAMHTLHAAGVRVPRPVLFYEGVLLMEVVIDADGSVAPRLVDAGVTRETAGPLYEVVRANVVKMLCADLIHGDLSEFNVLLAWDGPVLIDFPQIVAAAKNSRAEHFFHRDLENVRRFCGTFDPAVAARLSDADEIWRAYVRRELTPEFVPTGRGPAPRHAANARPEMPARGDERKPRPGQPPRERQPQRGAPQPPRVPQSAPPQGRIAQAPPVRGSQPLVVVQMRGGQPQGRGSQPLGPQAPRGQPQGLARDGQQPRAQQAARAQPPDPARGSQPLGQQGPRGNQPLGQQGPRGQPQGPARDGQQPRRGSPPPAQQSRAPQPPRADGPGRRDERLAREGGGRSGTPSVGPRPPQPHGGHRRRPKRHY